MFRYSLGVKPVAFLKARMKVWLSLKPHKSVISAMVEFPSARRAFACSIFWFKIYCFKGIPAMRLKT